MSFTEHRVYIELYQMIAHCQAIPGTCFALSAYVLAFLRSVILEP